MISLTEPLDLTSSQASSFLRGIQGNILKGHGRDFAKHVVLNFNGDKEAICEWISLFSYKKVTSEYQSYEMRSSRKPEDVGDPFAMFLLSYSGFTFLGFDDHEIPKAGGQFSSPIHNEYFRRGMKQQVTLATEPGGRSYNDPPSSEWEVGYRNPIHALIILADDDQVRLEKYFIEFQNSLNAQIDILAVEHGKKTKAVFGDNEHDIEHFGFTDGISQPLLIKQDIESSRVEVGGANWNPSAPLQLVLVKEPVQDQGYGSFMVFRKLEQNVRLFQDNLADLSSKLNIDIELAGAMATGRHKDGSPLVAASQAAGGKIQNDFNFNTDIDGTKCPFHSHIRKSNPRGDLARELGVPLEFERARRIVRRGITYGKRPDLENGSTELPESGVGLLFMCFQSNLDQFVIQQEGSDSNDFIQVGETGPDPITGRNANITAQSWPSGSTNKFAMANFVKMLGGEYFFAPSMGFLQSLKARP